MASQPLLPIENPDVLLIGSGVMSANLGVMLKRLHPAFSIQVYEATGELAQESSHGWNNAGTGHAGICELSYTPTRESDGTVNVSKAIGIFEQFEHSKQFWASAVADGLIDRPREFINAVPHISFVHGREMVDFLEARFRSMSAHHFFRSMKYSASPAVIGQWAPLLVEGRRAEPVAATQMDGGTDVNFGVVSRKLMGWLATQGGCAVALRHRVVGLRKIDGGWLVRARDLDSGEMHTSRAKFVFVGAGGGSLPLLQKARLPEARGLGGFPIGGQWLVCDNPQVVERHQAKVYGQPQPEAPTMAVPHLDTRILNGRKTLLFGPFASWTTKFLHKAGRYTDLPLSMRADNFLTLANVGLRNLGLIRYLVQQGTQSMENRLNVLRRFYPGAQKDDWRLIDAGIRVQAIKKTDGQAGIVHYGTEVMTSADRSLSALLGASPGASVSVNIVLEIVKLCFPHLLATDDGKARMRTMIPGYDEHLALPQNAGRYEEISGRAQETLQLR